MAGQRVVHVWREALAGSDRWRPLDGKTQGYYLLSVCMLAKTERSNELRGCLCVGTRPMTLGEWQGEMKIRRQQDAAAEWLKLHDVGLFEARTIGGLDFVHLWNFETQQDRFRPATSTERTRNDHATSTERAGYEPGTDQDSVENKRLTTENCAEGSTRARADHDLILRQGATPPNNQDLKPIVISGLAPGSSGGLENLGDVIAQLFDRATQLYARSELWSMTANELAAACAALEKNIGRTEALGLWMQRCGKLEGREGGLDFMRQKLEVVIAGSKPHSGAGSFPNPAAYLNKETSRWLKADKGKDV